MISKSELRSCLDELGLTQSEAARLLSVDPRTVRRWLESAEGVPGPAEQALRAWQRLHRLGLPWRPDGLPLGENQPEELAKQISLYREQAIQLDVLLRKVKARGGPAAPWEVDLKACEARLGPMVVGFYRLANGGFSPSTYRRSDRNPDLGHDGQLLEDAYACIAQKIAEERRRQGAEPSAEPEPVIDVYTVRLPKAKLAAMPKEERTFFVLLGQSSNEIMALIKVVIISTNKELDSPSPAMAATQSQIFVRLLIGKLNEAYKVVRRFLSNPVGKKYRPLLDNQSEQALNVLNRYFNGDNFITKMRNNYAFHAPDDEDIEAGFKDAPEDEPWEIYQSTTALNSCYFVCDLVYIYAMLKHAKEPHALVGYSKLISEAVDIANAMNAFLGGCIAAILKGNFGSDLRPEPEILTINHAPKFSEVTLPFFMTPDDFGGQVSL